MSLSLRKAKIELLKNKFNLKQIDLNSFADVESVKDVLLSSGLYKTKTIERTTVDSLVREGRGDKIPRNSVLGRRAIK